VSAPIATAAVRCVGAGWTEPSRLRQALHSLPGSKAERQRKGMSQQRHVAEVAACPARTAPFGTEPRLVMHVSG
jgi:hypothetical protein